MGRHLDRTVCDPGALIREVLASGKTLTFAIKHLASEEGHGDALFKDSGDAAAK